MIEEMSLSGEKLQASPPGSEIETNTESKILLAFIKNSWDLASVPAIRIDFGAHPTRTVKDTTLNTYRIISNIYDRTVGSQAYKYDVPVAIDVYVRDAKAVGKRDNPSPRIVSMEIYLTNLIQVNRVALRDKGINHMEVTGIRYLAEPTDEAASQSVWYHLLITVRMIYYLFRVPV